MFLFPSSTWLFLMLFLCAHLGLTECQSRMIALSEWDILENLRESISMDEDNKCMPFSGVYGGGSTPHEFFLKFFIFSFVNFFVAFVSLLFFTVHTSDVFINYIV